MLREHLAGEQRADECADAPENERDEALRGAADALVRLLVNVELPCNEEEIVARAVQQNRGEDERGLRAAAIGAEAEREIARHPARDAQEDGDLVAEPAE